MRRAKPENKSQLNHLFDRIKQIIAGIQDQKAFASWQEVCDTLTVFFLF